MPLRSLFGALSSAGFVLAAAAVAEAAPATTTTGLNMRTCASTSCAVITTIPAGARVNATNCGSWCQVTYGGRTGWSSAQYLAFGGGAVAVPPVVIPPLIVRPPMPPRSVWYRGVPPRWYNGYWYDGRRYWYNNRWNNRRPNRPNRPRRR